MGAAVDQNGQISEEKKAKVAGLLLRQQGGSAREESDAWHSLAKSKLHNTYDSTHRALIIKTTAAGATLTFGDQQRVKQELVVRLEQLGLQRA